VGATSGRLRPTVDSKGELQVKHNDHNNRRLVSQSSVNAAVKSICDVMRRSNCAGALQYVPELTWLLFLRILDEREQREAEEAEAVGAPFTPSLEPPYRWRDWAAPPDDTLFAASSDDRRPGWKRRELSDSTLGSFFSFVNGELLPYLRGLRDRPNATPRQKIISEILAGVERVRIDSERNLLDVLDRVHAIRDEAIDPTHVFPLSQVYEGLLLKMGEKGNDGGQFFTPREVIRAMVRTINPLPGETVYDPCCGTGGFLVQSYEHMRRALGDAATADQIETLKQRTFYGREKENLIYPIALANMVLHGIDEPHLWHGNTLTGNELYGGLFQDAPTLFDVVLTNPPFGGKEGKEAQTRFAYKTGATQVLFLQHVIASLKMGGRCGIVVDEGLLFRTNETAFVQTKRQLLDDCDLWCIVSLPAGTFVNAGASVKANLLFFTRGGPTERTWYYDLSDVKVGKKSPLTLGHFDEFFRLLPDRADSENSWTVSRGEIEARGFDLKAVNPHRKVELDERTPEEILDLIEARAREVAEALALLRRRG
jgi:type I restriction enzyme M protein